MATLSQQGLEFIAQHEGLRLAQYNDPAGHCTIGFGHLIHRGACTGNESLTTITSAEARDLLSRDAAGAISAVNSMVTVPLNQSQFDALVSFTFNVGSGALQNSTLLRVLNQGNYGAVISELGKWVKAGGQRLAGLVTRRADEGTLFEGGGAMHQGVPHLFDDDGGGNIPSPAIAAQQEAFVRTMTPEQFRTLFQGPGSDNDPRSSGYFEIAPDVWLTLTPDVNRPQYIETSPGAFDREVQRLGGTPDRGATAAELDVDRRRNELTARGQDISLQIADADRALEALQTRLAQANTEKDQAVAAGTLDLARDAEARIREFETQRAQLERDRFGLQEQRFGLEQQMLQLDRDIFDQQSQQFQQTFGMSMQEFLNNQALGQQGIALNAAALGISAQGQAADAVLGAGELFGSLGADLGDLEFRRDELLANLAANPRDFAQLNRELGGGMSFLQQLFGEEAVTGQSTRLIGEQTLGPAFDALVASLMQRPELEFFEQAGERAGDIPTFEELAGVEVPPAFFPEGPPLPPEPGFVDPATVGADAAGLLPPPDPLTAALPPPGGAPTADGSFQVPGLEGDFTFDVQQGEQGGLLQVLEALRGLSPEAAPLTVADAQLAAQQGNTAEAERIANLLLQGG